jgi:PadR family transcriptional regulator, regulatory protein AphA
VARDDNVTRYAILGQLSLRDWSSYQMVRSMARTLRWFWPRAESGVYAEAKRLNADGLITARPAPADDGSRRTKTVYSLTAAGQQHLRDWLATPPATVQLYIEPFLRLHLARAGTLTDLRAAVQAAEETADDLLRTAVEVAGEFLTGQHLFQQDLALRGLLFDGLWGQGLALKQWAMSAQKELARWDDLDGDEQARDRTRDAMRAALRRARELGITPADPDD